MLENSEIYIGDQLCASLGDNLPVNSVLQIYCQDPNYKERNAFSEGYNASEVVEVFSGTKGNSLTIKAASDGIL